MSEHYSGERRKRKTRREKIGFYTAFSICLIAVCMAVFSTYNTVNNSTKQKLTASNEAKQVNQPVTGVHATPPAPTIGDIGKKVLPGITAALFHVDVHGGGDQVKGPADGDEGGIG